MSELRESGEFNNIEVEEDILETPLRNALQIELAAKMIGHDPDSEEMMEWAEEYADRVREILYGEEGAAIREMMRMSDGEDVSEAADLLEGML